MYIYIYKIINIRYKGDRMKKVKKFLLGNIKTVVAFILGIIISGRIVYAATIRLNSNQVGYDNTSSGTSATNIQDALDELYTTANTIDSSYIDFATTATNGNETILASKNGVCIKRNNKLICFKTNNWNVEKDHIRQVFSSCSEDPYNVDCRSSDFRCNVCNDGSVHCFDRSDYSDCVVYSSGSVNCN